MLSLALSFVILAPPGAQGVRYHVASLPGAIDGPSSTAIGLANRGGLPMAVGSVDDRQGLRQAFAWAPDTGPITLAPDGSLLTSEASAVNRRGVVVGHARRTPYGPMRATLWDAGRVHDLPAPQGVDSFAAAVNHRGQVVGYYGRTTTFAISWGPQRDATILPQLGAGMAWDINDAGVIVGAAGTRPDSTFPEQACLWRTDMSTGAITGPEYLGSFTATDYSEATGINATGTVVGWRRVGVVDVAFYAPPAPPGHRRPLFDVPIPGRPVHSRAQDINDHGVVVGSYRAGLLDRAYLWSVATGFIDLNETLEPAAADRWLLVYANAVDNDGHIVGYGVLGGRYRGFLLVPRR